MKSPASTALLAMLAIGVSTWGQSIVLPGAPPETPATPAVVEPAAPLRLEWPAWLEVSGGQLVSQRTNPPGPVGVGPDATCPSDVVGKRSQGCLKKVYTSARPMKEVYEELGHLLEQNGFSTESASKKPYANLQLGKAVSDVFGSLNMRQYPNRRNEDVYRQLDIFLRQPPGSSTKVEITFVVRASAE
jgi:hypothetical protein